MSEEFSIVNLRTKLLEAIDAWEKAQNEFLTLKMAAEAVYARAYLAPPPPGEKMTEGQRENRAKTDSAHSWLLAEEKRTRATAWSKKIEAYQTILKAMSGVHDG